jgi:hypothetical protein
MAELREQRDGPTPPRNTTEPCRTCKDAGGGVEYSNGARAMFCEIPRDRQRLYPIARSLTPLESAVMPCWRPR